MNSSLSLVAALVAGSSFASAFQDDHGHPRTLRVPQDYPTISAAIDAASAGDRIKVSNGVYREQVIIDKPITLEGSSAEHTIIDGEGSTGLSGLGQVRIVAAGDVEFSKFKVINAGRPESAVGWVPGSTEGYYVAIYTESPVAGVTYEISHTKVFRAGYSAPGSDGYGLHTIAGLGRLHLHHCEISEQNNCAVFLIGQTGPVTISDNQLALGIVGADALDITNETGAVSDAPLRILRNKFDLGSAQSDFGFSAAITVAAQYFSAPGSGYTDVEIADNEIENIIENRRGITLYSLPGSAVLRASIVGNHVLGAGGYTGITVWGGCEGVLVEDNLITGITGLALGTPGTNGGIRLRGFGPGLSPVGTRIVNNHIEALRGISVESDAITSRISRNDIWALGPAAVELGPNTSGNSVIKNHLQTPSDRGDATVLDQGVNNIVRRNR